MVIGSHPVRFLALGARLHEGDALITFDQERQKYLLRYRNGSQWNGGYAFQSKAETLRFAASTINHGAFIWTTLSMLAN